MSPTPPPVIKSVDQFGKVTQSTLNHLAGAWSGDSVKPAEQSRQVKRARKRKESQRKANEAAKTRAANLLEVSQHTERGY